MKKHRDVYLVTILLTIVSGMYILYVYCYFGKKSTESHEEMFDCFYECNWLDLPPNLQKYFIIMIGNAQRPICYHGFGVAVLNLETFLKARKTNDQFCICQLITNEKKKTIFYS